MGLSQKSMKGRTFENVQLLTTNDSHAKPQAALKR